MEVSIATERKYREEVTELHSAATALVFAYPSVDVSSCCSVCGGSPPGLRACGSMVVCLISVSGCSDAHCYLDSAAHWRAATWSESRAVVPTLSCARYRQLPLML